MILWFTIVQIVVAILAALTALGVFLRGRPPNDVSLGATLVVGVLLIAQLVISIAAPFVGNVPQGDPLEYWMYLILALLLPFGAGLWSLIDRRRSANLVLVLVHVSVGVMLYRMLVIWES